MAQLLTFRHPRQDLLDKLDRFRERVELNEISNFLIFYDGPDAYGRVLNDMSPAEMRTFISLFEITKARLIKRYEDVTEF
jgi:hypothetical protein